MLQSNSCRGLPDYVQTPARISSIIFTVPLVPLRISDTLFWKCSGAEVIPNGIPKGVVSNADSGNWHPA